MQILVVDAANVVGTNPDGWWNDRQGAAARLHHQLVVADLPHDEIVLVLEGQAKGGVRKGRDGHVLVVHAPRDGDSAITREARTRVEAGHQVTVITADRLLRSAVEAAGAQAMSPSWLLSYL
ncbi:MAG: NYN domain-containing protein [Marmoricola sp.]|jgi:predicted RNA-binding protein with PIN domain